MSCTKLQLPPEPLTKGLPPPDPRPLCPLSSTEFVEPLPPPEKNSWVRHWQLQFTCGNKMPTRRNRWFLYCRSYCSLNMFRAPLCQSSGAQEYYAVQHPANRTHDPQFYTKTNNLKTTAPNTTGSNHCIILLSS